MKRSKQTIINRRIMHRYQQQYHLWVHIIGKHPLLYIPVGYKPAFDIDNWIKYCRSGVILINEKGDNL